MQGGAGNGARRAQARAAQRGATARTQVAKARGARAATRRAQGAMGATGAAITVDYYGVDTVVTALTDAASAIAGMQLASAFGL